MNRIKQLFEEMKRNNLGVYASSCSCFIFLSIVPFLFTLLSIIPFTPITKADVVLSSVMFLPDKIDSFAVRVIDELYMNRGTIISISSLLAVWSAAKGIMSLKMGLNSIMDVYDSRNYFLIRLFASLYTLVFMLVVVSLLILGVFEKSIETVFLAKFGDLLPGFLITIIEYRILIYSVIIFILILTCYTFLPNIRCRVRSQIPGAVIATLGWMIFTWLFTIYTKHSLGITMYGSFTTIVILLMWLYFLMYILFVGAQINYFLRDYRLLKNIKNSLLFKGGKNNEE